MRHFLSTTGVLFSVALIGLAGCSQSPQEQYDAAVESVNEAQSAIQEARKKVEKTEEKIAEAREDHQEAQQTLEEENRGLPPVFPSVCRPIPPGNSSPQKYLPNVESL